MGLGPRIHSEEGQAGTLVPGYRHLNKVMRKDAFPFSLIDECLDTLSGFAKLDANLALHQIKILALNRKKKCELFLRRIEFLERQGSEGTQSGVRMRDHYMEAVLNWGFPFPRRITWLCQLL